MPSWPTDRAEPSPEVESRTEQAKPRPELGFHELYDTWFDDVTRWVRAMGTPEAELDDIVQDVFIVVHRRLPDFDGENVAGWLYQIARRKVRDFRRLSWVKRVVFGGTWALDVQDTATTGPAESLERKRRGQMFEQMLTVLNDDQRAAFVLFEIEGKSGEEIAKIQRVPINTVWARIHKARKKLQERASRLERATQRPGGGV